MDSPLDRIGFFHFFNFSQFIMDWALIESAEFVNAYDRWKLLITEAVWTLYSSSDPPVTDVRKGLRLPYKAEREARMAGSSWDQQGPSLWRENEMCTSGKKGARGKASWLQYEGESGKRNAPEKQRWVRTGTSKGDLCFGKQSPWSSQEMF